MMYESRRPDADAVTAATPQAEHAVEWLAAREDVEQVFRATLEGIPSERDERLARMADVLQATAQGLGPEAAAVWAGVPARLLQQWLATDAAFASAVRAASALASAHGLAPGGRRTPAMLRVVVLALSRGETFDAAAGVAGLTPHKLRLLWRASPTLVALVEAARRSRPRTRKSYVPAAYRPRKPGRPSPGTGYRLVQRDDE
ncbi:hypothetical protein [Streptomyces sp. ITFR-16]|uniref:hypothetical protein n=1 Tax=Streptomyces sp. ITFR-16 TaxID=3075198 RepID=UPI00288BFF9D|nr:hypothetical protein [Streptomyces sp. ITFR-16]WNI20930.1 hypothetical protein RLT58_02880 [Streptomyces sp. ITFR-16]